MSDNAPLWVTYDNDNEWRNLKLRSAVGETTNAIDDLNSLLTNLNSASTRVKTSISPQQLLQIVAAMRRLVTGFEEVSVLLEYLITSSYIN